jgi:hypothetical protein
MKRYSLFFIVALLLSIKIFPQLPYSLSVGSQSFQYLSSPTIFPWGGSQNITLPFTFYIFGIPKTSATINITNDGFINLGNEGIVSFSGGMNQLNTSTQTSYETTGTTPSRIFKIEWKNQGLSQSAPTNDSITYQLWLHETSNIIEWHFGPSYWYVGSFTSNPLVIVFTGSNYYSISGPLTSPSFLNCGFSCHLYGIPNSGVVYSLLPPGTSLYENKNYDEQLIFSNPSPSQFPVTINIPLSAEEWDLKITDAIGRTIVHKKTKDDKIQETFLKGIYFVTLQNNSKKISRKLIVD